MGRLTDKNILITGGNSGIGLATAQEFDREGARVAICGSNERTLQAAKGTLGAASLAVRADYPFAIHSYLEEEQCWVSRNIKPCMTQILEDSQPALDRRFKPRLLSGFSDAIRAAAS